MIQNAAARLLTRTKRKDHITHTILKSLHWLPVTYRIDFKVLLLAFKSLNDHGPLYIAEMFETYSPSRSLRSAEKLQLVQPSARTKQGEAAFSCYAVRLWNRLPIDIKTSPTIPIFKSRLKTKLFPQCLPLTHSCTRGLLAFMFLSVLYLCFAFIHLFCNYLFCFCHFCVLCSL